MYGMKPTKGVRVYESTSTGPKLTDKPISSRSKRKIEKDRDWKMFFQRAKERYQIRGDEIRGEAEVAYPNKLPSIPMIEKAVSEKHEIPVSDVVGKSRKRVNAHARQELYYLLRVDRGLSYLDIGRRYGVDHSTVMHGVRQHCHRSKLEYPRAAPGRGTHFPSDRVNLFAQNSREPQLFKSDLVCQD